MNQTMNPGTVPPELYRKPTHVSTVSFNTGYVRTAYTVPQSCLTYRRASKYPVLPHELSSDIQQFAESHFAKHYFSTHRVGILFKRKVPVEQMMSWQKV